MLDWTVGKGSSAGSLHQVPTEGGVRVSVERTTQSGSCIQQVSPPPFPEMLILQGILVVCEEMVCCQR